MLNKFLDYFGEDIKVEYSDDLYKDFISQLGGRMFGKGLFNSFSSENITKWTGIVNESYPSFNNMFRLFGYDWLGRCFGIDLRKNTYGKVLLFEIGTGEILEIPCTFEIFLNKEIPLFSDACLAKSFFISWMDFSKESLEYEQCVGYKIPLFLGGEDAVFNLEKSDMDVYWTVMSQIKNSVDKPLTGE